MSQPYDSTVAILHAFTAAVQEDYTDDFFEPKYHMGGASREVFALKSEKVVGTGITKQAIRTLSSPHQSSKTMLEDFPQSDAHQAAQVKIRFHQTIPGSNDFGKCHGTIRFSQFDMDNKGQGLMSDFVEQHMEQLRNVFTRTKTLLDNVGHGAVLALVNGTKKLNDTERMADCTAYSSGSSSCRLFFDNGTAARLSMPGTLVDIVNSSGAVVADALRVTDSPVYEDSSGWSVGLALTSKSTVADCDGISDDHKIVLWNSYNQGPNTVEDWMTAAGANDSFIGGVNRRAEAYRWLLTKQVRTGATSAIVDKNFLTTAMQTRAHLYDGKSKPMIRCGIEIADKLRDQYEGATLNSLPTNGPAREAVFGTARLSFVHPTLGQVLLRGDEMMTPDKIDIQTMGDFVELYYGQRGVRFSPGTFGMFNRVSSATPGNGPSLVYEAQAYQIRCVWCNDAPMQTRILNVRAA